MDRPSPFVLTGEHLVDFIDKTLEAFHSGTGIRNNSPEPMTLDVVRRIIWSEIRRSMRTLEDEMVKGGPLPVYLWLRIEGATTEAILAACSDLGGDRWWTLRAYGSRKPAAEREEALAGNLLDAFKQVLPQAFSSLDSDPQGLPPPPPPPAQATESAPPLADVVQDADPVVVYAVVQPVRGPKEVREIYDHFTQRGLSIRDFTLGPYPY